MLLNYELEILEDLVFETLQLKRIIQHPPTTEQLTDLRKLLHTEKEAGPKRIRKAMNKLIVRSDQRSYIQLQQTGITRMLDTLFHYLLPKDADSIYAVPKKQSVESIYKQLYIELEKLLFYLKEHYRECFDHEAKLPEGYKFKQEAAMLQTVNELIDKLKGSVSSTFLELLCEPFQYFNNWEVEYNYRELNYLRELRKLLLAYAEKPNSQTEHLLSAQLMELNFNSILFFNYKILQMTEEASKRATVNDRVEYFSWQIKQINQTTVRKDVIYLKHLPPLQDQLVFWIAEDLYYLDKKNQLSLALPVNREVEKDKLKKVHVQLTVADLALGARLLLDTEVIVNMNYTELMKLVARSFRTNRQATISQQAIYNVGFESSVSSKEKMKQVLMKMVRKIGEY